MQIVSYAGIRTIQLYLHARSHVYYIDLARYSNASIPCFILSVPYFTLLLFRSVKYTPPIGRLFNAKAKECCDC